MNITNTGLQIVEPTKKDYKFGGQIRLGGVALVPSGQWDEWLPTEEVQNLATEPMACFPYNARVLTENMKYIHIKDDIVINLVEYSETPTTQNEFGEMVFKSDGTEKIGDASIQSIQYRLSKVVSKYLDDVAQQHGYDNILSACSYAGATNPFQKEGKNFLIWRSNVWENYFTTLNEIASKKRVIPTEEELISLLPTYIEP